MSNSWKTASDKHGDDIHPDESLWTDSIIFGDMGYTPESPGNSGQPSPAFGSKAENKMRLAASVFANTHDGIMITDANGVVLDVNRAYTEITGFNSEEIIGRQSNLLSSNIHSPELYESLPSSLKTKGFWRGEVKNRHKNGSLSTELMSVSAVNNDNDILTHYVAIFTDISALKESQSRLEHLAYHDALTGLPNRVLLGDRIQQAVADAQHRNRLAAICFLDLDDFKPINDTYGHQSGDRLLIEVAKRLTDSIREGDTVARLGGDEFALLLADLESPVEAYTVLSRLLSRIALPYNFEANTVSISASIGYTLVPGDEGDADSLLRHADQAMYVAKQEGRNRLHLFDIEQDQRVRSQRENISRIKKALQEKEFLFHFQPKVDMRRGKVIGMEALIRWQHPESDLLKPSDFLLPLGDHPLLMEIGDWGIHEALKQIAAWREIGLHLPISVNISGAHLLAPDFAIRLAGHLASFPQVNPRYLELEILETAAIEDVSHVSQVISKCREMGVEFALDDFGTGYSSLLYLKRLPAKTLKIDQTFIRDMLENQEGTDAMTGILSLAAAFKRNAIAEGVESIEQGIVLLRLNCDIAQGNAIARPMAAEVVPTWVNAFRPDPAWKASLELPWRRSDFPLLAAEVEQRRWLKIVTVAVKRSDGAMLASWLRVLSMSSFKHWLYGIGAERYESLPEMQKIPELYTAAYWISTEIAECLDRGAQAEAEKLLAGQKEHSHELHRKLISLRKAVAEFTEATAPPINSFTHSVFG